LVPGEYWRTHSASFASDHLIDVDATTNITGLESGIPGVLERGAIGNRAKVPVAVDIAVFVSTSRKPLLFRDAVERGPDRKFVDVQHGLLLVF
jgi:hypothetical protein